MITGASAGVGRAIFIKDLIIISSAIVVGGTVRRDAPKRGKKKV